MSKQFCRIVLACLLLSVFFFASCNIPSEGSTQTDAADFNSVNTDEETSVDTTQVTTEESVVLVPLTENSLASYQLISNATDNEEVTLINEFANELKQKTGITFKLPSTDDVTETENEMLFGKVNRKESIAAYSNLSYSEYSVKLSGNKICFSYYEIEGLKKMLDLFEEAMVKDENGNWCIAQSFTKSGSLSAYSSLVPKSESGAETLTSVMSCGEGNRMATFEGFTEAYYDEYTNALTTGGFSKITENDINGNKFTLYQKDACQVELYWYPQKSIFKVIYGATGYLPSFTEESVTTVCTPSVTQLGRKAADESAPNGAPGMSYVIQLSDGRFIIIDGGPLDENGDDETSLMEFLNEKKPASYEKPEIALWIITHAHSDHTALAASFLKDHGDDVVVDTVAYQFPDFDAITMTENAATLQTIATQFKVAVRAYIPKANKLILHTGYKFYVGDAEIEILYTPENHAPALFPTGNHTSIAFRICLGNKSMVFLGDSEKSNCQFMAEAYGTALKSDILQVTHHGVNGGNLSLYQAIDPETCFWPIDEGRFNSHVQIRSDSAWDYNKWILDESIRKRNHYNASQTTTILLG